jgi:hypothetical protein
MGMGWCCGSLHDGVRQPVEKYVIHGDRVFLGKEESGIGQNLVAQVEAECGSIYGRAFPAKTTVECTLELQGGNLDRCTHRA